MCVEDLLLLPGDGDSLGASAIVVVLVLLRVTKLTAHTLATTSADAERQLPVAAVPRALPTSSTTMGCNANIITGMHMHNVHIHIAGRCCATTSGGNALAVSAAASLLW